MGRMVKNVFYHLPFLVQNLLRGRSREQLEHKCHLWRLEGYLMYIFLSLAPKSINNFDYLDFRSERARFLSHDEY